MAQAHSPMRICVAVHKKSPSWSKAWDSPNEIISMATEYLSQRNNLPTGLTPLFLAKERWETRTMICFDLFHNDYEPESAHLAEKNQLPVTMIALATDLEIITTTKYIQVQVNQSIREFHDYYGLGSRPPFAVDHANGNIPTYRNPRTCRRLDEV
ncbi:hypothetical protein M0657_011141 [Pyricularia oryzae]|nr:hypothetical protein M9X92_011748 [Pyricularia oryzae]KAI7911032.1 hypothetical protein M0657_011141 [Pyricularia oryzae]